MVVSGWRVSNLLVEMLQKEAEISVYYDDKLDEAEVLELVNVIKEMDGVWDVRLVSKDEAYNRMEEILGDEAHILELFSENPFNAFIEVRIYVDRIEPVLEEIEALKNIDYVRDNKEILQRIEKIANVLMIIGYLVIAAVGITTIVIVSHLIRQGIYNNRDQINTLQLLGAPSAFIGFPFVLVGLLLTLGGGVIAAVLLISMINKGYAQMRGSIPFIPLPQKDKLINEISLLILCLSSFLGIIGSIFGLKTSKIKN